MTRLTGPHATVLRVDIIQFVENQVHFIRSCHNVAAGPDPLTEEMLMLNNIAEQYGTGRMLQRHNKRMRIRTVKFLDKTPLNPRFQATTARLKNSVNSFERV